MPTEIEVESHDNNSQAPTSFTEIPSPKIDVSDSDHPIAFFKLIWGETTSNFLAEQTNIYAAQKQSKTWSDTIGL